MSTALDELERRVSQRWAAAAAARLPQDAFDPSGWLSHDFQMVEPLPPPGTAQFPREQWASYPSKRAVVLILAERLLDDAENLTDEQWMQLCFLMLYGGKTRLC